PILRTVLRGVAIVPLLDSVAAGIFGGFLVQRLGKRERQPVAVSVPRDRHIERFAGVTDALKAAILKRARLPAGAPNYVEMAVARVEGATHRARQEAAGQRHRRALWHAVHDAAEDEHRGATAPGEVQQVSGERAPTRA